MDKLGFLSLGRDLALGSQHALFRVRVQGLGNPDEGNLGTQKPTSVCKKDSPHKALLFQGSSGISPMSYTDPFVGFSPKVSNHTPHPQQIDCCKQGLAL